jgi:hypothetical protein
MNAFDDRELHAVDEADWPGRREAHHPSRGGTDATQHRYAATIDIGEGVNNPANNAKVGRRLTLNAFGRTYGDTTMCDSGRLFERAKLGKEVRGHSRAGERITLPLAAHWNNGPWRRLNVSTFSIRQSLQRSQPA